MQMTQNSEKHIDICGEVYYDVEGIIDSFYTGTFSNKIKSKDSKDINQFNKMLKFFHKVKSMSIILYHYMTTT